jgi:hypothetical protein
MVDVLMPVSLVWVLTTGVPASPITAADRVTLRDGSVLLGQVAESSSRNGLKVIVRRTWVDVNLPDRAQHWRATERPTLRRAQAQRRERLQAWRRARAESAEKDDRINAWIDAELSRLADAHSEPESVLMVVHLNRSEVRTTVRRPRSASRALRLGWICGLPDVETMPLPELERALEGQGYAMGGSDPVSLDELLPLAPESDAEWTLRRAATEVLYDSGLRFFQYGGVVAPEPESGQAPNLGNLTPVLSDLGQILGNSSSNAWIERLRTVSGRGRVGAILTRLKINPDLATVLVESSLWFLDGGKGWVSFWSRSATVRPDELGANAGGNLAEDPQVQSVFRIVESLGLGPLPEELKQRSLNVGAATQRALGQARSALQDELTARALPVTSMPRSGTDPKATNEPKPKKPGS